MIFNGHTAESIEEIDEETLSDICVMYGDGILGGRGVYDALTPITAAIFNYLRDPKTPVFQANKLFPWVVEYEQDPDSSPDAANASLLTFLTQAPGFNMERVRGSRR